MLSGGIVLARGGVIFSKYRLEGQQSGEKSDLCPKTNSKDSA